MSPRKARKLIEATPKRASVRLRDKRRGDAAGAEEGRDTFPVGGSRRRKEDSPAYEEEVKDGAQEDADARPRREDESYVEEQIVSASGAALEEEDTGETRGVTWSTLGDGGSAAVEAAEREMFDPAWRQFVLPISPEPPAGPLSRLRDRWWGEASEALALAVETCHRAMRSTRRRFQPLARMVPEMDIEDIIFHVIQALTVLVLLSAVVHVGWKIFGIDLDYAAKSACKVPSLHEVCRLSCEHEMTKTLFPNACLGHGSADGDKSHILSDDQAINEDVPEPSLLEQLSLHQLNCASSRYTRVPKIYDELPILVYIEIAVTSSDVCNSLETVRSELINHYTGVRSSTADIHNDIHIVRELIRGCVIRASNEQCATGTDVIQEHMARGIPLWQEKFRALEHAEMGILDVIDPSRQDLRLLLVGLEEGLAIVLQARNETILQLPWQRKCTSWTQLSWLEPEETRTMTQAILVLKQWVSEASALQDILDKIESDIVAINRMIRDVSTNRLGHSTHALGTDAELSEMLSFLDRISEDVERICSAAEESRVMGRFLQSSGIKVCEQLNSQAVAEAEKMARGLES